MRTTEQIDKARWYNRCTHSPQDRLVRCGVPPQYWGKTFEDYQWHEAMEPAVAACRRFADTMVAGHRQGQPWRGQRGPLLVGRPSVGKTTLACLTALALIEDAYLVRFVRWEDFVRQMVERIRLTMRWERTDDLGVLEQIERIDALEDDVRNTAQFVVFDDMGKEHKTKSGFAEDLAESVLRERHHRRLPSMITSNLAVNEWGGSYSQSMQEFVLDICEPVALRLSKVPDIEINQRLRRAAG